MPHAKYAPFWAVRCNYHLAVIYIWSLICWQPISNTWTVTGMNSRDYFWLGFIFSVDTGVADQVSLADWLGANWKQSTGDKLGDWGKSIRGYGLCGRVHDTSAVAIFHCLASINNTVRTTVKLCVGVMGEWKRVLRKCNLNSCTALGGHVEPEPAAIHWMHQSVSATTSQSLLQLLRAEIEVSGV